MMTVAPSVSVANSLSPIVTVSFSPSAVVPGMTVAELLAKEVEVHDIARGIEVEGDVDPGAVPDHVLVDPLLGSDLLSLPRLVEIGVHALRPLPRRRDGDRGVVHPHEIGERRLAHIPRHIRDVDHDHVVPRPGELAPAERAAVGGGACVEVIGEIRGGRTVHHFERSGARLYLGYVARAKKNAHAELPFARSASPSMPLRLWLT